MQIHNEWHEDPCNSCEAEAVNQVVSHPGCTIGCMASELILADGEQTTEPLAAVPALPAPRPTEGSTQHPQALTAMP